MFMWKVAKLVWFKISHHLLNFHSQEISALTNQFPAPTVQEQQFSGGNSKVSLPSVSNMEYSTPSESAPMLDAMETGINSPVSAFRPIVNEMPNTSEERTLSPPQCRLEYLLANCIAWFCYGMFGNSIFFSIFILFYIFTLLQNMTMVRARIALVFSTTNVISQSTRIGNN